MGERRVRDDDADGHPPEVDGYRVDAVVGRGAGGDVWSATETATGRRVALKRLPPDADADEAALLASVEHPSVLRVLGVVADLDGRLLVTALAGGGSLDASLRRRGRWPGVRVLGLLADLGGALAELHSRGLVHGDVTPSNVLLDDAGRPLLGDLGGARVVGRPDDVLHGTRGYADDAVLAGHDTGPAGDVRALAAVAVTALSGGRGPAALADGTTAQGLRVALPDAPEQLVALLGEALDVPARRPSAGALASRARSLLAGASPRADDATPAGGQELWADDDVAPRFVEHVAVDDAPSTEERARAVTEAVRAAARAAAPDDDADLDEPEPRRWARVLAVVGLVALLAVAGVVLLRPGGGDATVPADLVAAPASPVDLPTSAAPSPAEPPLEPATPTTEQGWVLLLRELDEARADAYRTGDPAALVDAQADGSPASRVDQEALADLAVDGVTVHDLRHDVSSVEVLDEGPATVRLRVADRLRPYELRDADGRVLERTEGRGVAEFVVVLVTTSDGWRVSDVQPA